MLHWDTWWLMMAYECVTLSHIQQTELSPVRSLAVNVMEQFCITQQKAMDVYL